MGDRKVPTNRQIITLLLLRLTAILVTKPHTYLLSINIILQNTIFKIFYTGKLLRDIIFFKQRKIPRFVLSSAC